MIDEQIMGSIGNAVYSVSRKYSCFCVEVLLKRDGNTESADVV